MASSRVGRRKLVTKIKQRLVLDGKPVCRTKKQAEQILREVIACLEETLITDIEADGFTIKLYSFGKLSIRHKSGIYRKIPFTGEMKMTKDKRKVRFTTLGKLRQLEVVK